MITDEIRIALNVFAMNSPVLLGPEDIPVIVIGHDEAWRLACYLTLETNALQAHPQLRDLKCNPTAKIAACLELIKTPGAIQLFGSQVRYTPSLSMLVIEKTEPRKPGP